VIFASNESIKKGKAEYKDKYDLRDNLSQIKCYIKHLENIQISWKKRTMEVFLKLISVCSLLDNALQ